MRISVLILLAHLSWAAGTPLGSSSSDLNAQAAALFAKLYACIDCKECPPQNIHEQAMANLSGSCSSCVSNCYFGGPESRTCNYWDCGCSRNVTTTIKKCRTCLGMPGVEDECGDRCDKFVSKLDCHQRRERGHRRGHGSKPGRKMSRGGNTHRHTDD